MVKTQFFVCEHSIIQRSRAVLRKQIFTGEKNVWEILITHSTGGEYLRNADRLFNRVEDSGGLECRPAQLSELLWPNN